MSHHRSVLSAALLAALFSNPSDTFAGRWRFQSPAEPGLYAVGHEVFEMIDATRNDRAIAVDVWYPVDTEHADGTPTFYDFGAFSAGMFSQAALDGAAPAEIVGFPLVVYSHSAGGLAFEANTLTEGLAAHGFVVAALTHPGDVFLGAQD